MLYLRFVIQAYAVVVHIYCDRGYADVVFALCDTGSYRCCMYVV